MVNLKAAVYDSQQQAKKQRITPRVQVEPLGGKNRGIEMRIQKDKADLRNTTEKDPYMELKKKAHLYEQMVNGYNNAEQYDDVMVDFASKQMEQHDASDQFMSSIMNNKQLVSDDMKREAERMMWEDKQLQDMIAEEQRTQYSKAVHAEAQKTLEAREKVKQVRKLRKRKLKKRIERIKSKQQSQPSSIQLPMDPDSADENDDEMGTF